jgi:hypothetical protein
MRYLYILVIFTLTFPVISYSAIDLLVLGDSQTGATWSKTYFGNYLQKCLKEQIAETGDFVVYARGATQPTHWIKNAALDNIETIQRDAINNHKNIGNLAAVPLEKKRIEPMLQSLQPKKVLLFFGDNLMAETSATIETQFKNLLSYVSAGKIEKRDCYLLTPTFEMEVSSHRNVKGKTLENTNKVIAAMTKAAGDSCQVINGLDLIKASPYYLKANLVKRVAIPGDIGCTGAATDDNIHLCGEAARYLAQATCNKLKE